MTDLTTLRLERDDDGVVRLTLADPERRNAIGYQMAAEMITAVAQLRADDEVRALVITGEDPAFCAGADVPGLFGGAAQRPVSELRADLQRYYRAFLAVLELPFVTIAAVNGPAVGAGLNLAMSCDLRLVGPRGQFGVTFSRIGLHPGGGCTWFLVRALGASRALRTILLGRTIGAEEAVACGLADGPEEDVVGAAVELARRVAALDPLLSRHIKRSVRLAVETGDLGAVLEYESWAQAASASSDEMAAWVQRFQ